MKKLFFLCVVVIAYFTLYPWTFVPFHEHSTILEGLRPLVGKGDYLDIVVNLCFYLPLGVLGVLGWWKGSSTAGRWIALAALGAALSFTLETIQAWIPGRDSSLLDILTNTIGTIAGARLGVAIAGYLPSDPHWELPSPRRPMPAVLIAAWLVSQWFPFLPILRIPQFSESLHALMQVSSLGWIDLADAFVAALLIGRLLREALTSSAYHFALAGACLVLPARLFIVVGAAPWPLAVCVRGRPAGVPSRPGPGARRDAAARHGSSAADRRAGTQSRSILQPLRSRSIWIPFSGFLEATRDSAIRVASGKFFLYGTTVWMIRESGVSLGRAAGVVGGLLMVGEYAQRYLPGRVAESTDPVLVVIAACIMVWLKDRPPAPSRMSAGYVRENDQNQDRNV